MKYVSTEQQDAILEKEALLQAFKEDWSLFNEHFTLDKRNGLYIITHNQSGMVMKRGKSSTVIDQWVGSAIETLKARLV